MPGPQSDGFPADIVYLSPSSQHTHVNTMPLASRKPYCFHSVSLLVINRKNSLPTKQHMVGSIGFRATCGPVFNRDTRLGTKYFKLDWAHELLNQGPQVAGTTSKHDVSGRIPTNVPTVTRWWPLVGVYTWPDACSSLTQGGLRFYVWRLK